MDEWNSTNYCRLYSLGLPAAMVVGTSVFVLIFNSLASIGCFYLLGRLDPTLIIILGGGSAVGAFIGPLLLKKINTKTFEKIYGPMILGMMVIFGFWVNTIKKNYYIHFFMNI